MIVLPSWEGQGQLKTRGTLVLVKQTLAQESRHPAQLCGWCWLSCVSTAECEHWAAPGHIWPRSGRGMSHPEPSHPQSPGPGDVLTPHLLLPWCLYGPRSGWKELFRGAMLWIRPYRIVLKLKDIYIYNYPFTFIPTYTGKIDAYLGCNLNIRS